MAPKGARTEHGALTVREYGLLAPEGPAGNPDAAVPQGNGEDPEDTIWTGVTDGRETRTGERDRQRKPLTRGQTVEEERIPPERKRTLNTCSHQGG